MLLFKDTLTDMQIDSGHTLHHEQSFSDKVTLWGTAQTQGN